MIITVTLNPAIDRTVEVERLNIDKVNRVKSVRRDAGGKGINVTKTIKALGGHSEALVVLGGENGAWIRQEAMKLGIQLHVVNIVGETRENIKLVDLEREQYTDLNEKGPLANPELERELVIAIEALVQEGDYLVLAGSPLPGMDTGIFKRLCEIFKAKGVKVVLDVDGPYLVEAIEAKPFLIKPNQDELSTFLGLPIVNESQLIQIVGTLINNGVSNVAVSRGDEGLLFMNEHQTLLAKALKVEVKSTVGAGDAVVAALVKGLSEKMDPEDIVKTAVATATSVIMQAGSQTGNLSNLNELINQVDLVKLDNSNH